MGDRKNQSETEIRDSVAAAEARKRMKLLDPTLHAWFMRQGVRRE